MTTRSRRSAVASAWAAAMLALAAPASTAHAQEGWTGPTIPISAITATGGAIAAPRVAVDTGGNALAVWTEPGPIGSRIVKGARYSAASGLWGAPITVSAASARVANTVRLAADAGGNGIAIWEERSGMRLLHRVHGALRRRQGRLGAAGTAVDRPRRRCHRRRRHPLGRRTGGLDRVRGAADRGLRQSIHGRQRHLDRGRTHHGRHAEPAEPRHRRGRQRRRRMARRRAGGSLNAVPGRDQHVVGPRHLSLAVPEPGLAGAAVAVNAAGDAVAVWSRSGVVEAARAPAGLAFGAPATVSPSDGLNEAAGVAIDPFGNAVVAWTRSMASERITQVSRYDALAAAWSAPTGWRTRFRLSASRGGRSTRPATRSCCGAGRSPVRASACWRRATRRRLAPGPPTANLSTIQRSAFNVDVAFDAAGRATAVWFEGEQGFGVIQSRSWLSTLPAPSVTGVTPTSGHLAVTVAPPAAVEAAFAATTFEYSLDGGATWTPRAPSGVGRPWRSRASPTASSTTYECGR